MRKALSIAGLDTGGGAGVLADVKTFSSLGVYGMAAVTAITAQNTREIISVVPMQPDFVEKQIRVVIEDIGVDAAKTGMLVNAGIIKKLAQVLKEYDFPIVVDPVMVAKTGDALLEEGGVEELKRKIIPIATIITPNRMEAEKISGVEIKGMEDAIKAAKKIAEMGADYVLIKGGHLKEEKAIDILYHDGEVKKFPKKWQRGCTHGVGCSFSAAIAAMLAKKEDMENAIKLAEKYIEMAIRYGVKIGKGNCPVNHIAYMQIPSEKWNVYEKLGEAVENLVSASDFIDFIPEVGTNFAYSLPKEYVDGIESVAAIDGRIVRGKEKIWKGEIKFGASSHLAGALIKAMEYDENVRAVMNIKYDEEIVKAARKIFTVSFYDRKEEPKEIKGKEGATMPWGIEYAIKKAGKMPDVIYHKGEVGKEPMILIFGKEPYDVIKKFNRLKEEMKD